MINDFMQYLEERLLYRETIVRNLMAEREEVEQQLEIIDAQIQAQAEFKSELIRLLEEYKKNG